MAGECARGSDWMHPLWVEGLPWQAPNLLGGVRSPLGRWPAFPPTAARNSPAEILAMPPRERNLSGAGDRDNYSTFHHINPEVLDCNVFTVRMFSLQGDAGLHSQKLIMWGEQTRTPPMWCTVPQGEESSGGKWHSWMSSRNQQLGKCK